MTKYSLTAIVTIVACILRFSRWLHKTYMKMQETIMTNQQFLKQYLVAQQTYSCHSTTDMLQRDHNYDTQSYLIGIDNHASASMTNSEIDFVDTPAQVKLPIKGIKGHLSTSEIGPVRWIIQDDEGRPH
jgi:Fe-S cluster assembly iron-binding protein IscA